VSETLLQKDTVSACLPYVKRISDVTL